MGMSDTADRVMELMEQLAELGSLLPGSISEQWNTCGKSGCRCKAKDNPQKHGPYYQLSYSIGGKSSSMFIKPQDLAEARRQQDNYREFKQLNKELVLAYVAHTRAEGLSNGSQEFNSTTEQRTTTKHE